MNTRQDFEVIASETAEDGTTVEVIAYPKLRGSADVRTAESLFFANQCGMRLKMARIILKNSYIRVEPGALYYMHGNLEMKASTGGGIIKGLSRKLVSGETFFVNEIHGSGVVYLEPTFGHFFLHRIAGDEGAVIVDKGLFFAGTAGLSVSAAMQKSLSSALFGGEGLFQTKIAGVGVALLYTPVPHEEVQRFTVSGDTLSVDGNFALMRSAGIKFSTEKSSKSWLATSVSGEGLLQTFRGSGYVWIAPTQGVYEKLARSGGIQELSGPPGSRGTKTVSSSKALKKRSGCLTILVLFFTFALTVVLVLTFAIGGSL